MIFSSIEPKGQSDIVISLLLSSSVNCHVSMFFSEISGLIETQLFYGLSDWKGQRGPNALTPPN